MVTGEVITRRTILQAVFVGASCMAAGAGATVLAASHVDPDAELLSLFADYVTITEALNEQFDRQTALWASARGEPDAYERVRAEEEIGDMLCRQKNAIADRIIETPAFSVLAIGLKVRILQSDVADFDGDEVRTGFLEAFVRSVLADVERIGGAA